jgi:hypothetical protein
MSWIGDAVKKRIPNRAELKLVFGVVVFAVFSWTIWNFIYEIPSSLLSNRWSNILWNFQTLMAAALVESVLVTIGLSLLGFLFPAKLFRDGFPYKSFVTLVLLVGVVVWVRDVFASDDFFPPLITVYRGGIVFFVVWIALLVIIHFAKPLQRFVLFVEERTDVFSYLYIPLGLIGLISLLLKNVVF